MSVGAGVGTWLSSFQSFVQSFTGTTLQYIDMHVYPVNMSFLSNALTVADMAADVEAARLLVYRAAWVKDRGLPATKATSIAKLFATEAAMKAASQAVLLHGNRGYSNEYPVERYYRDIKGLQIYEGTSHIQRLIIARELVGRERK